MPRLSDSMEEGTILKWLVSEGDEVEKGQEIAEIETDKANMTFESDTAGTVIELVASEGDTLALGEVIARVGEAGEKPSEKKDEEPKDEDSGEDEEPKAEESEQEEDSEEKEEPKKERKSSDNGASADGDGRVKPSPVAKRMAKELGVELGDVEGSGPGGRIIKSDVEAAAESGGTKTKEKTDEEQPSGD